MVEKFGNKGSDTKKDITKKEDVCSRENPSACEELNKGNLFKIEPMGSRFSISYLGEKQIKLYPRTIQEAIKFRNFLDAVNIKNQSCLELENLSNQCSSNQCSSNQCSLKITKGNEVFYAKDYEEVRNSFFQPSKAPLLYQEGLPEVLKGDGAPANTVEIIMNYMNRVMESTVLSTVKK